MSTPSARPKTQRRFGAVWALAVLLLTALGTLLPFPSLLPDGPASDRFFDALHLPLFGLFAVAIFRLLPSSMRRRRRLVITAIVGIATAASIELIQPSSGRSASWADFFYGSMGVGVALWFLHLYSRRDAGWSRNWSALSASALIASLIVLAPVWSSYHKQKKMAETFPNLLSTDIGTTALFWKGQGDATITVSKSPTVAVTTSTGDWSGVKFDIARQDWSAHSTLVLQINGISTSPFALGLKIDDNRSSNHSDRYNDSLQVQSGINVFRIAISDIEAGPKERPLNLQHIAKMALFIDPALPAQTFVIERAALE